MAHLDVGALHAALDLERQARDLSWREVSRQTGVSPSTLSRIAHGKRPDVDGFASLVRWLGASADDFLRPDEGEPQEAHDAPSVPAAIASYLRTRNDLSPRHVAALEAIMAAAYDKLRDEEA